MLDKFDSIYADSVNDEISFDLVFDGEEDGALIESVQPDLFFDESGAEKSEFDFDEELDGLFAKELSIRSIADLDNKIENDIIENNIQECGDDEIYPGYSRYRDDYYGSNHNYETDDFEDKDKYHDHNDEPGYNDFERDDIHTVNDLDRHVNTYAQDDTRTVIHAGDDDLDDEDDDYYGDDEDEDDDDVIPRSRYYQDDRCQDRRNCRPEPKTIDDLDRLAHRQPISEDDGDDSELIDMVDRNDGTPDNEATPADFRRKQYNYEDNSYETRNELKEAKTMADLDTLSIGLANGVNVGDTNHGLDTEESEYPYSDEAIEDGEDIDSVMGI